MMMMPKTLIMIEDLDIEAGITSRHMMCFW